MMQKSKQIATAIDGMACESKSGKKGYAQPTVSYLQLPSNDVVRTSDVGGAWKGDWNGEILSPDWN